MRGSYILYTVLQKPLTINLQFLHFDSMNDSLGSFEFSLKYSLSALDEK